MQTLISHVVYQDSCIPSFSLLAHSLLAQSHRLLRYRVVRYLCGVDIDHLTKRVTEQLPHLSIDQQRQLVNDFNYSLKTDWQVDNAIIYQEIIENTLYNHQLTFTNFPMEILNHLLSYLNEQELVNLQVCKKLIDPIMSQSLLYDFRLKKLLICSSIQIIDIFKYINHFGELIKVLDLSSSKYQLNDEQLDTIFKKCTKITYLNLENQKIFSNSTLKNLTPLTSLRTLNLNRCCSIANKNLILLTSLEKLESIHLGRCCQINDQSIKHLQPLIRLKAIYLNWTKITDNGLQSLLKFTNLKELYLAGNTGNTEITDQGLMVIKCLVHLTILDLSFRNRISDQGVNSLRSLIHLKWLSLAFNSQLTYKSLQILPFLPQLKEINIIGWSTIDQQAMKAAESLVKVIR